MSGPYRVVSYQPKYKAQIAALQTHLWSSEVAWGTRYFEWKYEQNPYLELPLIYLAFSGDELVGMRGFYGARWESGSPPELATVLVADDFVVAPAHRNRGLVTLIMRAAFDDLASRGHRYVLNLSGGPVTVVGSLAMGWKSAGRVEPMVRTQGANWFGSARRLFSRTPHLWRYAESPLLRSPGERKPFRLLDRLAERGQVGAISIERAPRLDAMSELVQRLGSDGRIRHVRDREFFAWRFRNPLANYRFLYCGTDRLEGYLALKAPHPAAKEALLVKIVDLEASGASVRAELLRVATRSGRFPNLFAWAAALPAGSREQLTALGFRSDIYPAVHSRACVLVRNILPQLAGSPWLLGDRSLTTLGDWDLRMLYTMAA